MANKQGDQHFCTSYSISRRSPPLSASQTRWSILVRACSAQQPEQRACWTTPVRAAVRLAVKYTVFGTTRAVKSDSAATTGALAAPRSRAPACAKKRAQSTPHVTRLTANAYVRTSKRPGHDARKLEVIVRSHVRSMVEYVVRRLQVEALFNLCEGCHKHMHQDGAEQ